ncbi:MAG TPA: NAD(P)/FAD-dependent oxidoreductase [Terracidiphilus sp.]|nr:NAD(P)/FAD-dependent oxidoreductase [Terracidiphilus sp.]
MGASQQTAVIIGAGPAGLTAALEFCRKSSICPIVLEASNRIGGISCTIRHNGNRIDIGGHRFFSKSDRVMDWWTEIMPIAADGSAATSISYQNQQRKITSFDKNRRHAPADPDCVMLVRPRKSRIYFMRSFFDYPLSLSAGTLRRLGLLRTLRILGSYMHSQARPRRPEKSLEDFIINRFGRQLYRLFFKSYTEKVWGVPCEQISAAWGAQRIKGLSLRKAAAHFFRKLLDRSKGPGDIRQKNSETSLIEQFLYPKFGPGQLWERVAKLVEESGGEVRLGWKVTRIHVEKNNDGTERITSVLARDPHGALVEIHGDYFFSTMPVRELLRAIDTPVPAEIHAISDGLQYRDFITVGLLVDRLLITEPNGEPIKDTWIYIQEPDVLVGRLQIFNNWSPHMVADPSKIWIGLEYFCYDSDPLWKMPDKDLAMFAVQEIASIGIVNRDEVRDFCVHRMPKTYPAYFGTYERFNEIVRYMERFENLFLVGRNGMHKYNNQDHSMLTAMMAVENILAGIKSKQNLWEVNTEQEYHEQKSEAQTPRAQAHTPVTAINEAESDQGMAA